MIAVTISRERIAARGHAADAVGCAAVSALLYALAGGLENLCPGIPWRIGSGSAAFRIPDEPEAQAMRLMAEAGLRQLAEARQDIRIFEEPVGLPTEQEGKL